MKKGNGTPSASCSIHCTDAVRGNGPARGDQVERSSVAMAQKPRQN